jgi:hypothetical protein
MKDCLLKKSGNKLFMMRSQPDTWQTIFVSDVTIRGTTERQDESADDRCVVLARLTMD